MQKYLFIFLLFFFSLKSISQAKVDNTSTQVSLSEEKAQYYLKQLQIEYGQGNYEEHKAYSDSLYLVAKENGLVKYQILGMVNQAVYHNNKSEQNTSVTLYRDALELCNSIPEDYRTKIIVLVNLGNVYNRIGANKKGIRTMKEVLSLLNNLEDNEKIKAAALLGLASNYEGLKDYDNTIAYLFKAKALATEMNSETILATVLSNLSDTYYHNGDYKKAINTGEEALTLSIIKNPDKKRAWLLLTLGNAELKGGNKNKALQYLEEAQQIALNNELVEVEMHSYEHLAELYTTKKDLDKAKLYREKYLILQNKFLATQKEATRLDLEKDLDAKDAVINSNETALSNLLEDKSKLIFWSVLVGLLLSTILFFTIRQKKQEEQESEKLRKQLVTLKETSLIEPSAQPSLEKDFLKNVQYKNSSLTPEDHIKFKEELLSLMNNKKPYVDYNLNQADLASQLGISSHHLSEVLRFGFEQNFYNFINSYRVLEAQKLMEDKAYSDSKILAIGFESGFKSKTSFNRVFKDHTGMTPSEYKKKLTC